MAGGRLRISVAGLVVLKLVVNTAVRFVYPFLPAITRGLGIDLAQGGVLMSTRWAAGLLSPGLISLGLLPGSSRLLILAGLATFAMGAVVTAATGFYVGALVGFALLGLGKPLLDVGAQVYVSERVPYSARARYLGLLELSWAGGLLVGAPLAGWLIDRWSWETPFWLVGGLALVGLGAAILLLDPHDTQLEGMLPRAGDSGARSVAMLLVTAVLFGFAHESVLVVLGSWLEDSFGLTLLALGGVGILLGLAELVGEGTMIGFADRLGKRNSVGLGLLVAAGSLFALSVWSADLVGGMAALLVATTAMEFGYIATFPLASELRPRARTRVLAWLVVATGSGRILSDLVAPRIYQAAGVAPVMALAAAVAVTAGVIVLAGVAEVRPGSEGRR